MAELIKKSALIETLEQQKQCFKGKIYNAAVCMVEDTIKRQPTTTEAEIRAKAIDEFAEYLKEIESISAKCTRSQSDGYSQIMRVCEAIAEQLKEE